jgi:hypothetical protein
MVPPESEIVPVPAVAVTVPPHDPVRPLGVATTKPAGSESVNATPERAVDAFELLIVNVSEVDAFCGTLGAPNTFAIDGGATTVSEAVFEVDPVPPSVELMLPVVLSFCPAVAPVTFTTIVHDPLDARVPPDRPIEPLPAVAVVVPLHVFVRPFGVETTKPAGNGSVNATPDWASVLELFRVKVRLVDAFNGMLAAPKAFEIVGGPTTVSTALFEAAPVPPSVEVTAPVVLVFCPPVVPVMFTTMLQEPLAASVPPDRLIVPAPAVAVTVPPHEPVRPFGVATIMPAGSGSVKAMPDRLADEFGLLIVKVKLVVAFSGMFAAPNAFEIVGGATTVS